MKLNRRNIIIAGTSALAIAGVASYFGLAKSPGDMLSNTISSASGITSAQAADIDLADLDKEPTLGDKVMGQDDAKVTIIEYASATCPHCAAFHNDVFKKLKAEYVDTGKVRFIFREFPFDDLALAAFMVARCAPADKYYPMIDVLFEQQRVWASKEARVELGRIAKLAGFTEESYQACLKNEKIAKGIIEIRDKAEKSYGVDSTPTFFIGGKKLLGNRSIEDFEKAINEALK